MPLDCTKPRAVNEEGPEPSELDNVPLEHYDGMDDGVKNHWTFSNGEQFSFVEHMPNRSPAAEKSVNQRKQKGSKRKCRHTQTTNTRSRKRNADKKRQFNQHAIKHLENVRPAAMCIEDKSLANMTRSAAGKGRRRKASLNRSLAAVGLSENQQILVNQCLKSRIVQVGDLVTRSVIAEMRVRRQLGFNTASTGSQELGIP